MYKLEKKFKYKENYYKSGKMKEEEIEEIFSSNFNRDVELKNVVLNLNSYKKKLNLLTNDKKIDFVNL